LRISRVAKNGKETYGLVSPDTKTIITREEILNQLGASKLPLSLEDFIFSETVEKIKDQVHKLSFSNEIANFKLLPPITRTFKIICLAFNYSDQTTWVRFGKSPPKDPVIYMKSRTSLAGPYDEIICPKWVSQLDYEGELAFVIGKKCKGVKEDQALKHVGGYFVLNDVSARDIQFIDKQYSRAKSFDTFGPCGPWLTTTDEIPDPHALHLTTKVNGEPRQSSSTSNLVLKIERIIQSLSRVMTLEPGDIISTGTPSGTVLSLSSHLKYLKDGDIIEVEIEKLGKIRNRVTFID
jgi:2-keto-4-pentenoate hydratase/2-oxohepta-3-ene-1,7-dioic acid hydratase in catechol pathway